MKVSVKKNTQTTSKSDNIALEVWRCRLLALSCTGSLYVLFLCLTVILLQLYNDTLGWWDWACAAIQNHPLLALILFIGVFLMLLSCVTFLAIRRLRIDNGHQRMPNR